MNIYYEYQKYAAKDDLLVDDLQLLNKFCPNFGDLKIYPSEM